MPLINENQTLDTLDLSYESELTKNLHASLRRPRVKDEDRNAFIKILSKMEDWADQLDDKNEEIFLMLRDYLSFKLHDQMPLSETEIILVQSLPELNDDRIITVEITDALMEQASKDMTSLNDAQRQALNIVITDALFDGELLTSDQEIIANTLFKNSLVQNASTFMSYQEFMETEAQDEYGLSMEYGYDVKDKAAVAKRLQDLNKSTYAMPLSNREIKLIKRLHQFDPTDSQAVNDFCQEYGSVDDEIY
ncbi:hypothetical protein [Suttonella ornithocola]|uniref:Uncharacterized protein n=1 Tax=Suttonella ornithocola TaxID=279832 RepID=A0A380MUZ0_9GAMM|nr:hypothetical protein [Suttonella ornithocola]SUO96118.1 Uncharacterised protein [Suttonella ornithocola]